MLFIVFVLIVLLVVESLILVSIGLKKVPSLAFAPTTERMPASLEQPQERCKYRQCAEEFAKIEELLTMAEIERDWLAEKQEELLEENNALYGRCRSLTATLSEWQF